VGRTELPTDALRGIHVLLVEDDEDARDLISIILRYSGALVTAVGSADEALATLERVKPDLLISDIAMPVHDGYWLIQRVRELPADRNGAIPAIAITAHGELHGVARTLAAGFQGHLRKPIEPWELARTVTNLVAKRG
jgi:CheY-like chemotaxis protein